MPVLEHDRCERLHVVGDDVAATDARGQRARRALDRERAARARAEEQIAVMARRVGDVDDVPAHLGRDVQARDALRPRRDRRGVGDLVELLGRDVGVALRVEQRELGVAVGVADAQAHEEAVELGLGQGIGALELDRVLRRDHHERRRQRVGVPVDRDLALLHRLEQRRLRLRRRAVDLVGEHDVREHRARAGTRSRCWCGSRSTRR